jgi:glycosyltransferase involved in cell wall biosynthesis
VLLQTHAFLVSKYPQVRTVIVGDGPERGELEAHAEALGVASSITFAGYRSDVRLLMSAFDIYVNSSSYEGVSLTILEAMATALPVVATRVGGNPEVVIDHETGFLVPGLARSIADAIGVLVYDERRRRVMGDAGRFRVKRHFSIARMVEEYAEVYLGTRPAASTTLPANAPIAADTTSVSDATRSIV